MKRTLRVGIVALVVMTCIAACTPGATTSPLAPLSQGIPSNVQQGVLDEAVRALPSDVRLPTVSSILAVEAIITSFEDTYPEANPQSEGYSLQDMQTMSRDETGAYLLPSGWYSLDTESFCLKAGTHGPSRGDGYLPAPLLGDREAIVYKILRTYAANSQVSQKEVQVLIWAIVANTRYLDMAAEVQATANALLTEAERFELNNGALGLIPDSVWGQLERQLPAPVRQIYAAEQRIRNLVSQAGSSYTQLEDVAILDGEAPESTRLHEVSRGQWAEHPDGYYIRYYPKDYTQMRLEVFVPERDGVVQVDVAGTVATPANTAAQRLGIGMLPY